MANGELDYYYVSYSANGFVGCKVVYQFKHPELDDNPDGFNISGALMQLREQMGQVCIIHSWQKTTKRRYDDFNQLLMELCPQDQGKKAEVRHLKLINPKEPPTDPAS